MAMLRVLESVSTLILLLLLGLISPDSVRLFLWLLPAVALGAPIGRWALRALSAQTFRRVWLTADLVLVSVGLTLSMQKLG